MGYTKSEIITIAEENVNRGSELDTIAEKRLNLILDQLYESYSWLFLSKEPPASISLSAGSAKFSVPADFLSIQTLMLIDSVSNPTFPPNIPLVPRKFEEYQQILVPTQTADKPQIYSLNIGYSDSLNPVAVGYVWPIPTLSWTLRMAYFYKPAFDIADGAEPQFPDTKTLVELLTNELYQYLQSSRYDPFLLEKIIVRSRRNQASNPFGFTHRAPLDKTLFKRSN